MAMRRLLTVVRRTKYWRQLLPVLVGVGVSIVTLLLWRSLLLQEYAAIERKIELATVHTTEVINQQLQTRILALTRMAGRWQLRGETPFAEWEADASSYLRDYPGFQAIEWVDSSFYVRWIVPIAGNEAAQNMNLATEERRRTALEAAVKRRNVTITHTVNLVQSGKGFLVYLPLFLDNQKSKNPFDGFIIGVFRTRTLLDYVVAKNVAPGYAIALFDGEQEIYRRYDTSDANNIATTWGHEKELNLYGVSWRVRVWATQALLAQEQSPLPTVVLCSGLATAALLALSVYLTQAAQRSAKQVKRVNQELAQKIAERKQVEIALRASEQRYATLAEASPVSIFRTDGLGHCLYVNSRWCKITGLTPQEAIGEGWARTLHPEDCDRVFAEWYQAAQANVPFGSEYRFMRDDGVVSWVFGQAVAEKNPNGEVIGYIGTLTDITARKQAESALQESEERWQLAVRGSNDAIWDWNVKTSQVFFSSRWKEMRGFAEHEIGHSLEEWLKRIHPDDIDWVMQAVEDHFAKKTPFFAAEYRVQRKDGSYMWILDRGLALWDEAGNVVRMAGSETDISKRKRAEEELSNLSKALESAVEGISQLDTLGRYTKVNPAYASMLGYLPEELMGMECKLTVHPEDREKMWAAYQQMLVDDKVEAEVRGVRKDGSVFDQQVVMIKAYDQKQQFVGCYRFMKDISDRREIDRLKDEFVSVVSHELRTPLTSISAALDLLASGILQTQPHEAERMLNIAANNTERLVRLVNDILDIERINSGKVQMSLLACDAFDLMTKSAEVVEDMADKAGVKLLVSPLRACLWADPDRIIQVITNLLSNAIKFSPSGSTVWLSAEIQHNMSTEETFPQSLSSTPYILFQVRDQGRGIPADKMEVIFERFGQVDASDSRQKGGTGLGLAICRSILQHHQGQIWAQSILGEGSTFFFTLPILPDSSSSCSRSKKANRSYEQQADSHY